MTTGAFSQNVSKLFSELKLVTDNLSLYLCQCYKQAQTHVYIRIIHCCYEHQKCYSNQRKLFKLSFNSTSILGVVYCQSCKVRLAQRVCLYVNQSKNLFRTSPLTPGLPCVQLVMLVAWYARLFSGFTYKVKKD